MVEPSKAVLSDINVELISCMTTVRDYPEKVISAIKRFSNTRECYYKVRPSNPRSEVGMAARFIYLSRTCWGGLYRVNESGNFNVPFGNSGRNIISSHYLRGCAKALTGAKLMCSDFEKLISKAGKGDVVYADPPYTINGKSNGFIHYNDELFSWEDQQRLAKASERAARRGAFVAITGIWHADILSIYPGWWALKLSRKSLLSRNIKYRRKTSEVLLLNRKPRFLNQEILRPLQRI